MEKFNIEQVLEALKEKGKNMTAEDIREQKISFIMGMFSHDSNITREFVEAQLDKMYGLSA